MTFKLRLASVQRSPTNDTLSSMSLNSIGADMRQTGANPASVAWGTAQLVRYIPFTIPETVVVTTMFTYNGATAAGTVDIGIYSAALSKIVSSGATSQSGTNAMQTYDITDTTLQPGLYYWGVNCSNATATFFCWNSLPFGKGAGVFSQATAADTLPTTAVPATLDAGVVPIVGMTLGTTI